MKYGAYVAIDWADREHAVCLLGANGKREHGVLTQCPKAIEEWAKGVQRRFRKKPIAVICDQKRGALVNALRKYEFLVVFPMDPAAMKSFRKAFAPSGAKDDPTDAELMLEFLLKHPERLTPLQADTEETRTLQVLVEERRKLVNDRKLLGNRLTSLLKEYYPLVLELFPKMGRVVLCEFLLRYPTLQDAKNASDEELLEFFRAHRSYKFKQRLELIQNASPLTEDRAILETSSLVAQSLARQIIAIVESTAVFDAKIKALYAKHEDRKIFDSLPATGEHLAPRLLAMMGTDRDRFSSAKELQQVTGVAPVLKRSGSLCIVHWRWLCSKFTRQSIIEWAGVTIKHSLWARAFYAMQREKGKTHPVAVRALAYKWLRIIYRLWKNNETYNEAVYLEALQRNGSPIFSYLANNPNLKNVNFSSR